MWAVVVVRVSVADVVQLNKVNTFICCAAYVMQKFPWQCSHLMATNSNLPQPLRLQGNWLLTSLLDATTLSYTDWQWVIHIQHNTHWCLWISQSPIATALVLVRITMLFTVKRNNIHHIPPHCRTNQKTRAQASHTNGRKSEDDYYHKNAD